MKITFTKLILLNIAFLLASFSTVFGQATDLIISEYVEGSSNNKAIELYNGTGSPINLATGNYTIVMYNNGGTSATVTIPLTGTIAANGVFVLAHSSASFASSSFVNQTNGAGWFNGNDAVILRKGGVSGPVVDIIGQLGFNPGIEWGSGNASTENNTLRRKAADCTGDTNPSDAFDPSLKYDGFAQDVFSGLGSHTSSCTTGPGISLSTSSLSFTANLGAPSAQQSYTVQASDISGDITVTVPALSNFGVSLTTGGPYTGSVTVTEAAAEAGPVTVYVVFNPAAAGTQSGNITHVSGSASANLAVQGTTNSGGGVTNIYTIQGTGSASTLDGTVVTTEGIVTADFQGARQMAGFFIQDSEGDGNPASSDGIFVYNSSYNVNVGDRVRLTGEVDEYFNKTEIKNLTSLTIINSGNTLPAVVNISLPVNAINDLEALEGMLVKFPQTLTVTETYTLGRYGEVSLSVSGRIINPTDTVDLNDNPPSGTSSSGTGNLAAVQAKQDLNNRSRILLDDASTVENPPVIPYVDPVNNTLRSGSTLTDLTGVLDYDFSKYRLQPTVAPAFNYAPRPSVPAVGVGNIKVAAFNVLNYFNGNGTGGGFPTSRGAHTAAEFTRQRTKIINAIKELNADVVGLIEIENDGSGATSAIADLVNGLNTATAPGTYAVIADPTGSNGGPGTDEIKVALIYKPASVTPNGLARADMNSSHNRPPLAQTFTVNSSGEKFTAIVVHFKSKSCTGASGANADQNDGQSCYNPQRKLQATALLSFISNIQTSVSDMDVIAVGDFNSYEQEDPMDILRAGGLINTLPGTYSYVFDGQFGSLDYALVTSELNAKISGANKWHINSDEPIAKDYNQEYNPPYAYSTDAYRSSDHDPVLVGLNLAPSLFKLQLLHASDFEGGAHASNFAAIIDTLEGQYPNTVVLSSGDNYIPGPMFSAGADRTALDPVYRNVYNQHFGPNTSNFLRAGIGRADLSILNLIGFQASAMGNHEFDAGTATIAELIGYEISGTEIRWMGAQFPYLSANLDFSADASLSPLFTNSILPNTAYISRPDTLKASSPKRKIAPATIINVNGERIGVVGATTQILESISSTGGVTVKGNNADNMAELATYLQPYIDSLTNMGINKIILLAHLQQIALEKQLVSLLNNVDIVVAGGSSTLLSDANDVLRPGDVSAGAYPYVAQNANGQPALVVNTDQEYKYVGRLVVDFDAAGVIVLSSLDAAINGVYATTDETVTSLWGSLANAFAAGTKGNRVKTLVDAVNGVIIAKDGNILGKTDVFLEGRRTEVRTQETNLGNITSDANISIGKLYDSTVKVSIKNGGGIRAAIGEIRANPSTGGYEELPPQANPLTGKQTGEISQLDVENSLRFNNSLSLITVKPAQLLRVLNHGVAAIAPGATPGQFAQVGGVRFSYDPSLAPGSRVLNAVITDSADNVIDVIAVNGVVQGDTSRPIRVVTLTFLLTGGDGYPFNSFIAANPSFANQRDLVVPGAPKTGNATFTDDGSEQDAFAEYLASRYRTVPYNTVDTDMPQDTRIQNLAVRSDSVLGPQAPQVSIVSPINNTVYQAGRPITLQAQATDADGTISKVEFYHMGALFLTDSVAPYEYTSNGIEAGSYVLTAKAYDNTGATTVSDTVRFSVTACTPAGHVIAEGFLDIPGGAISDLTASPNYPNNPSLTAQLNKLEYGPDLADNYGVRIRGYICAPQSGVYTFGIASDNQSEFWLSTDDDPAHKVRIAFVPSATGFHSYAVFASQLSAPVTLVKGGRYYFEVLHKESAYTDHLSVGWKLPSGAMEAAIDGKYLSPYVAVPVAAQQGAANVATSARTFEEAMKQVQGFSVKATPNPSQDQFVLTTASDRKETITIIVSDAVGRIVEKRTAVAPNSTIRFGAAYRTGIYFVEVRQNNQSRRLKLVKQ
jgi:predicted extracellular nuclease/2',3'-cyclic-nucleotide 2'-phosphodiesterase (5'-nucleotidase family)